ncbi:hypothetical protein [Frankia sp. AgB32]|uniref:hypothetical protein n=1 Tax=Frankia sp. AgB32 TaxID=631119 RepID=UPI00200DC60E|nr:hypothetical protein [Frankia sp. AgB32]MCK9893355.1 hypothetical protein [Frankia sp. AgB32]
MRAAGLLATPNTDDPALTFDDMVAIALDGVAASWLPADDARALTDSRPFAIRDGSSP